MQPFVFHPAQTPLSYAVSSSVGPRSETEGINASRIIVHLPHATVELSAADPHTFHIVICTTDASSKPVQPPVSPFVVEKSAWRGAKRGTGLHSRWLKTPFGRISVNEAADISIQDQQGKQVLKLTDVAQKDGTLQGVFVHAKGQRLYGCGNEDINQAGPLIHTAGTSRVANGVTQLPLIWSMQGWGILFANDQAGISWSDQPNPMRWKVPARMADIYVMLAPFPYGLLRAYGQLTGNPPIPPRWTLGFMQSRWGYVDAADVQDKWHQFRNRHIPIDAFIYDYDWFINDWDFNPITFPDPKANLATMHSLGLHFVGIRKPRVRKDHLDYAKQKGWILTGAELRYDLPGLRDWWWQAHAPLIEAGVDGWWNDEGEHYYDQFFYMTKTEWDGGRAVSTKRVWTLNRAFAPGMQRFGAAAWTGDINSSWDALAAQPGTLLNWSACGMPFVGQDIGGFNGTPSSELYTRWIEEGVFVPVMRAHGIQNSPRWPWAFGEEALAATRKAINLRYRLLPYLYTAAEEASRTDAPVMRPLFFEFPQDAKTLNLEDEWLLGRSLLAAPILNPGGARDVYLPKGVWYDFNSGKRVVGPKSLHIQVGLDVIPAYVRAGTILPLGPVMQYVSQKSEDPLEIRLYPGSDGQYTLYEDAGDTYAYQQGACARIPFRWNDRLHRLYVGKRTGNFPGMLQERHLHIVLPNSVLPTSEKRDVLYKGSPIVVQL